MSDGIPTEEQRRRIERGVLDRIDARRRLARGLAGGAVAVVLLAGGIGLVATSVRSGSGASTAGAGYAGSAADGPENSYADGGATVRVTCALASGSDSGAGRSVTVQTGALPIAAVRACGGATDQASVTDGGTSTGSSSAASSAPEASSARPPAALCVDVDGGLIVIARTGTSAQACTRAGLRLWER